jgi:hypothetical protein
VGLRRAVFYTAIVYLSVGSHQPALSQVMKVDRRPLCENCTVYFRAETTLQNDGAPASPGPLAEVVDMGEGGYWVASLTFGAVILQYAADGAFEKEIGRRGEGPGEFAVSPTFGGFTKEGVLTLDHRLARVSLLDRYGHFVRSTRLDIRPVHLRAVGRRWIVSGTRTSSAGIHGLHVVTEDGHVERSEIPTSIGEDPRMVLRTIAVATDQGGYWTASIAGGRIERWGPQGELLQMYRLDAPAVSPQDGLRNSPTELAQVLDLDERDGRLWIYWLIQVSDAARSEDVQALDSYGTHIDVIDISSGKLYASGVVGSIVRPLHNGRHFDLINLPNHDRVVRIGSAVVVQR